MEPKIRFESSLLWRSSYFIFKTGALKWNKLRCIIPGCYLHSRLDDLRAFKLPSSCHLLEVSENCPPAAGDVAIYHRSSIHRALLLSTERFSHCSKSLSCSSATAYIGAASVRILAGCSRGKDLESHVNYNAPIKGTVTQQRPLIQKRGLYCSCSAISSLIIAGRARSSHRIDCNANVDEEKGFICLFAMWYTW